MDANAELEESIAAEKVLGSLYHGKFFGGDGLAVYETGGEAGKGWFAPGWESHLFGKFPDFCLGKFSSTKGGFLCQVR